MGNTTQEIFYQAMAVSISAILALLGSALRKLVTTKIQIAKYGFENDRVERILANAIDYAEQKAKEFAKVGAVRLEGSRKLELAKKYINKVDQSLIVRYANTLDDMITRKVAQRWTR